MAWEVLQTLLNLEALIALLIGLVVFAYWWWLTTAKKWTVGGIYFWPEAVVKNWIPGEKVIVSLKFILVNPSVLPEVVELLTVSLTGGVSSWDITGRLQVQDSYGRGIGGQKIDIHPSHGYGEDYGY